MNLINQTLLSAYYHATLPLRRAAARVRSAEGREPVRILFYHRVADNHPNDWSINCRSFVRQIEWIAEHYEIVSLAEGQRIVTGRTNDRPRVAVTFDDGYAENCEFALPYLLDRKIPFTYFVTSGNVIDGRPFPHDTERGVPLPPNSVAEIRELAAAGVDIGAHTRTHSDLGAVDDDRLADEIIGSKHDLERITGQPVRHFAFPYGQHANMTPEGFRLAHLAGYDAVCSAYGGYNFPSGDAFHLQRFHADPQLIRLKNWLTIDPRKLRSTERFDPGDYAQHPSLSAGATNLKATFSLVERA